MPLINCLENSDIIQTWYADDSSCQGKLAPVNAWWSKLNKYGPSVRKDFIPCRKYPITHPNNISEAQKVFRGSGIKIVTGHRLLGGYIGESFEKSQYLKNKVKAWVQHIKTLTKIAKKHPQTAHAAITKSLQHEWTFTQKVLNEEKEPITMCY
jgi:hypothetical protein